MKRLKKLLAYLLCVVLIMELYIPVHAEENKTTYATESGLSYIIDENDEITITGYSGTSSLLIIPESIEGKIVTNIGNEAFFENKIISSVEFPETLKKIGRMAFLGCDKIEFIEFPKNLEWIGVCAFQMCYSLKKVIIYEKTELEDGDLGNRVFSSYANGFKMYGYKDSPAEAYAKKWSDPFVYHDWIPLTSITLPDEITINLNEKTEIPIIYGPEDSHVGFHVIDSRTFTGPGAAEFEYGENGRLFITGKKVGQNELYITKFKVYDYIDKYIDSNVCKVNIVDPSKINAKNITIKDSNNKVINDTTLSFDTYMQNNECEITIETDPIDANEPITFTSTWDKLAKVEIRDGKYILSVYKNYIEGTKTATITATGGRSGVTASFNVDVTYSGASSVKFNTSFYSNNDGRVNRIVQYSEYEMPLVVVPSNLTQDTKIHIVNKPDKVGEEVITYDKTSGVLKAVGVGTATITAECKGQSISYDFEVTPYEKKATSVTINTDNRVLKTDKGYALIIDIGESYHLTSTVEPADTTDIKSWLDLSKNGVISIDNEGNVTALKVGTAKVVVYESSYTDPTTYNVMSEELVITVIDPNAVEETPTTPTEIKAESIKFNKTTGELRMGETFQIVPTIVPSNTTDTLTFRSNRENVATVSETGLVTAVGAGSAWIIGEINGYEAYYIVTVPEEIVKPTLTLSNTSITLKKGETKAITAIIGENTMEPNWSSANEQVATITSNGVVTAVGKGTTYIEATSISKDYSMIVKASCTVTVLDDSTTDSGNTDNGNGNGTGNGSGNGNNNNTGEERKPGTIKLNASKFDLQKGKTTKALAITTSTYADDPIVSVTSSNSKIVKASFSGNTISLKGVKVNSKYVTITVKTKSGASATCKVRVVKNKVATKSLKLNKKSITLKKGKSETLLVTQTPISATDKLTWSSSNKKVATVNSKGKIVAKKKGSAVITLKSSNGKKVTCKVKVK